MSKANFRRCAHCKAFLQTGETKRYCSVACQRLARPRKTCEWCGTTYGPSNPGQRFCSIGCGTQNRISNTPTPPRNWTEKDHKRISDRQAHTRRFNRLSPQARAENYLRRMLPQVQDEDRVRTEQILSIEEVWLPDWTGSYPGDAIDPSPPFERREYEPQGTEYDRIRRWDPRTGIKDESRFKKELDKWNARRRRRERQLEREQAPIDEDTKWRESVRALIAKNRGEPK